MSHNLPEPYGVLFQPAPEHDVDAPEEATAAIRILEPAYHGVVIRYNTVRFEEAETAENATVHFDYDIIHGHVAASNKTDFEITLGNLLYDIMIQSVDSE